MKKIKKSKYLLFIIFVYAVLFFVAYFLKNFEVMQAELFKAVGFALLLNFLNSFLAIALFLFSVNGTNRKFLVFNLGGIGVRIFLMLIGIIIILKILKIDLIDFILVFFVFYFVQIFFEIRFFHKFNNKK